ncbi:MAG: flagellar hook assembly protein FlgD [Phycisphaerae bacterium]
MTQMNVMGSTAEEITTNYLNLLVAQLQNQNPLEPMSNDQMAGQLAQLSALEQTEQLNDNFSRVLDAQLRQEATTLSGKEVTYLADQVGEDGKTHQVPKLARVGAVAIEEEGLIAYLNNGDQVPVDSIHSIGQAPLSSALSEGATLIGKEAIFSVQSPDDVDVYTQETGTIRSVRLEDGHIRFVAESGFNRYEFGPESIIGVGS